MAMRTGKRYATSDTTLPSSWRDAFRWLRSGMNKVSALSGPGARQSFKTDGKGLSLCGFAVTDGGSRHDPGYGGGALIWTPPGAGAGGADRGWVACSRGYPNSTGQFRFLNLVAGTYLLSAVRTRFAPQQYGQKNWKSAGTPIFLPEPDEHHRRLRTKHCGNHLITGAGKWPRIVLLRAVAGASLLAPLWYFEPPAKPAFQLCGFHWLTGRLCPLCGLTRAMFNLAKGHWSHALGFNALSPLAFAMLAVLFWRDEPIRGRIWTCRIAAFIVYRTCRILLPVA
jgi:hypothetical protein